mmetsp:Transcript_21817/g.62119  ORF Transcript_21817/g.62119 Transcript_21817/m.62119 type:complete len:462 (+) Transcript_21817:946-2331(+)
MTSISAWALDMLTFSSRSASASCALASSSAWELCSSSNCCSLSRDWAISSVAFSSSDSSLLDTSRSSASSFSRPRTAFACTFSTSSACFFCFFLRSSSSFLSLMESLSLPPPPPPPPPPCFSSFWTCCSSLLALFLASFNCFSASFIFFSAALTFSKYRFADGLFSAADVSCALYWSSSARSAASSSSSSPTLATPPSPLPSAVAAAGPPDPSAIESRSAFKAASCFFSFAISFSCSATLLAMALVSCPCAALRSNNLVWRVASDSFVGSSACSALATCSKSASCFVATSVVWAIPFLSPCPVALSLDAELSTEVAATIPLELSVTSLVSSWLCSNAFGSSCLLGTEPLGASSKGGVNSIDRLEALRPSPPTSDASSPSTIVSKTGVRGRESAFCSVPRISSKPLIFLVMRPTFAFNFFARARKVERSARSARMSSGMSSVLGSFPSCSARYVSSHGLNVF